MSDPTRTYWDHAATSWPKSDAVLTAVHRFAADCGAAAGRGGYSSAVQANQVVQSVRRTIGELIGAESSDCVSLHGGGTSALNAAIHGILRPGDHVVTTTAEHNSVLRPLEHWRLRYEAEVTVVPADNAGLVDADRLLNAVTDQTRLVALTSASNVTGAVQPIQEVGRKLATRPTLFLCDAAQTFGCLPIDVTSSHIDLLAAPGHKGSGGPMGTGFLYVAARHHDEMLAWMQGGTGSQSESLAMPTTMPSMLEPGNLNVPALAGWLVALEQLASVDWAARVAQLESLATRLHRSLESIDRTRTIAGTDALPIASIHFDALSPHDVAMILDAEFGIQARAGLHCAALIHDCIGTSPAGTLRLSGHHGTTHAEIDSLCDAIRTIAGQTG